MNRAIKPTAVVLAICFSICTASVPAQNGEERRPDPRIEFDKLVNVFMISDAMARQNQELRECFGQLIESANRVELPDDKRLPNVRILPETCSSSIDRKLANEVSLVSKNAATENSLTRQSGFTEQTGEPPPLNEPAKLGLTDAEQNVVNPSEAQLQYQKVALAAAKNGFRFQMHPMVQQFIGYYQGRGRSTMETGLHRSGMFMLMARKIFREEGVEENVAWLGQVESAWKPTAMSWAAASGLWQFIPGTGARFGLRRTAYVDERNSFEKATRASARYLKFLVNRYNGNWELAMAAYNSGEGNVDRAIKRAGAANFWAAYPYLPKETRNYVPNILATILIANDPKRYGFGHVRPAPQLSYDLVRVPALTNLRVVAQSSGTTVEYIRYLNPELRSNITPPEPYVIRVPAGKTSQITATQPVEQKRIRNLKSQKTNRLAGP